MFGEIFALAECSACGASVPRPFMEDGSHVCRPDQVLTHQLEEARRSVARLESDIAAYLQTERAQKLVAFRRWCVANGR
jgi:hypothetical protein